MQERVAGQARRAQPVIEPTPAARLDRHAVILGLDPSLRGTGYGVLQLARPRPRVLAHGTVVCPAAWPHSRCLVKISQALREVVRLHQPVVCVVEGLFHSQNLQTALIMGEARGAALAAVAEARIEIYELAPRRVKQAIVGFGGARKEAVARMVQRLLALEELPSADAADALALALAHVQEQGRYSLSAPRRI